MPRHKETLMIGDVRRAPAGVPNDPVVEDTTDPKPRPRTESARVATIDDLRPKK